VDIDNDPSAQRIPPHDWHPSLARLGEFLRGRRVRLEPGSAGIIPNKRRRTPGLRREEVAALAGISVDWYTRIELGTGVVPSAPTLRSIARALQLGALDTRFLFEIAGLPVPHIDVPAQAEPLTALEHAILHMPDTAAIVYDVYASPRCWNSAADGMFRWSRYPDAFSRNAIVAGLTSSYYREFFGEDFDQVSRGVTGIFRRAYTTTDPPPLIRRVYEFASGHPYFMDMWNEYGVSQSQVPPGPFVRFSPDVGELHLTANDLFPLHRSDLLVRFISPSDEETRRRLARLAELGTASPFLDPYL
jgi:transcriptional regulator with XRE-family HTH domain